LLTMKKYNVDRFGARSEVKSEVRTWHGVVCTSPIQPG
jgi:CRISPR-associated endonuclease Csn1